MPSGSAEAGKALGEARGTCWGTIAPGTALALRHISRMLERQQDHVLQTVAYTWFTMPDSSLSQSDHP